MIGCYSYLCDVKKGIPSQKKKRAGDQEIVGESLDRLDVVKA